MWLSDYTIQFGATALYKEPFTGLDLFTSGIKCILGDPITEGSSKYKCERNHDELRSDHLGHIREWSGTTFF